MLYEQVLDTIEIHPHRQAHVEWRIYNYASLPKKADTVFISSEFSFSNAQWQFRLCPNGQRSNHSVTYMSLYLEKLSAATNQSHSFHLKMGIRSNNGEIYAHSEGSFCFNNDFRMHGWSHFIERAQLQRNWYRIGLEGDLILFCDYREDLQKSVATQTGTIDGIDGLSKNFQSLLHSKRKSDVRIKVQNQEFSAHKLVLEARSSVFAAMFEHDMKENSSGIVNMDDCDPDIFQNFLTFIYTGRAEKLSSENASRLFALSDKYDVRDLKGMCLNFMKTSLSIDNVCDVMAVADRYDEEELRASSKKMIVDNIKEMIQMEQWIEFMREHPLLASEVLMCVIH